MALVEIDSWEIEFEGCEKQRHQVLVQLHRRQQEHPHPTQPQYKQLTASIHTGLEQLRKDVAHLKTVLDDAIARETCTPEEQQRRRSVWDKLTSQLREIDEKFTSSSRADRMAAANSSSVWQDTAAPTATPIPTDVETLKRRQIEMMEDQNRGLDMLSATISRQRQLATQLGTEVEDQNSILDNLVNSMDRVESGVLRETRSISQVNRRDSTWGYWLVIIALFVGIIVVVLL